MPGWPGSREIHLWQLAIDSANDDMACCPLDAGEIARAERFAFRRDRSRYIAAHVWLRRILGSYLELPAERIALSYGTHGKPRLAAAISDGRSPLWFNLSHSGDHALLAVASDREIGVDIEVLRVGIAEPQLMKSVLSAAEQQALATLPRRDVDAGFLRCWARKEAVLKALGCGLNLEPSELTVGPRVGRVWIVGPGAVSVEVACIDGLAGCVAAVAAVGGFARTVCRDLPPAGERA
ncbi:MAG: 4'-phosphopantetheinyl transferase superfamily protein [Gammaproteobacteria bacterium]|nr:4'-phosphopantetheinyl transferase superfamily protein [Gammaproteobacteria bacterium]